MKTIKQSYFVNKPTLKGRGILLKAKQLISEIISFCITICLLSSLCEFIAKVSTKEKKASVAEFRLDVLFMQTFGFKWSNHL